MNQERQACVQHVLYWHAACVCIRGRNAGVRSWNCVLVGIIVIAAQGRTWADLWQVSQDHSGVDLHAH